MKTMKKVIAVLLCLCMVMTAMVFSVSAEDGGEEVKVSAKIESARATKVKEDDKETVLQLEMVISASKKEDGTMAAAFDTLNNFEDIIIRDALYEDALFALSFFSHRSDRDSSIIATAKPVSYENGVLTADVYAKDGTAGAKLVAINVDNVSDFNGLFVVDLPDSLLKDSVTGTVNDGGYEYYVKIDNLVEKQLKLPSLATGIYNDLGDRNKVALIAKTAILLVTAPVVMLMMAAKANKVYSIYGIDSYEYVFEMMKYLPAALLFFTAYVLGR